MFTFFTQPVCEEPRTNPKSILHVLHFKRKVDVWNILLEWSRSKILQGWRRGAARGQWETGKSINGRSDIGTHGGMKLSSALQEAESESTLPPPDPPTREGRRNELMFGI